MTTLHPPDLHRHDQHSTARADQSTGELTLLGGSARFRLLLVAIAIGVLWACILWAMR